jgi:hypothetical protein
MKTRELTVKQINSVPCTTCWAAIGEPCELHSGGMRFAPHQDRRFAAIDAIEAKRKKRKLVI